MARREGALEEISRLTALKGHFEKGLESLDSPRPVDDLVAAVERAQDYGPVEVQCQSEFSEIQATRERLKRNLSRQTLWTGTLEGLEGLNMPSLETIDRFEKDLTEAEAEVTRLKSAKSDTEEDLLTLRGDMESLSLEQEVPTEKDLQEARGVREKGWALVKKAWKEGRQDSEAEARFSVALQWTGPLAEAYELSVRRADEIADRLRREADRVAAKARLLAEEQTRTTQLKHLEQDLQKALQKRARVTAEWTELWKNLGVSPLSPREMRAWCQDQSAISEEAARLRERRAKAETLEAEIQKHLSHLDRCLQTLSQPPASQGETLTGLIKKARRLIQEQEELRNKKEQLLSDIKAREGELQEARAKVERIDAELAQWKRDWEEALGPLGLDGDALPAQANAVLEELKALFDKVKEAESLQTRISAIDRDAETFRHDLNQLAKRVAPDLVGPQPEQIISELNARLVRAREGQTKREGFEKQQAKLTQRVQEAEKKISEVTAQLTGMCKEAGCMDHDALPEAERRSSLRRKMEEELEDLQGRLRRLSAGATVEEFVAQAEEVDPDSLKTRINRLEEEIKDLNRERSELDQQIGSERTVLQGMDGGGSAAELAEERQQILARLQEDIEKYVRLRLASAVLAQTIEQYRERHQGPVLKRTNALFSQLTLGSFEGVRAEYDDQGEAVLVGVRPGGQELVRVEGMSDGTSDQLYLALRLASLESYLEQNEAMPFIVDDILIKFDNHRAVAALQVLGDLSKKTQVIFFTHHQHLVDLAESTIPPHLLFKHTLPP